MLQLMLPLCLNLCSAQLLEAHPELPQNETDDAEIDYT